MCSKQHTHKTTALQEPWFCQLLCMCMCECTARVYQHIKVVGWKVKTMSCKALKYHMEQWELKRGMIILCFAFHLTYSYGTVVLLPLQYYIIIWQHKVLLTHILPLFYRIILYSHRWLDHLHQYVSMTVRVWESQSIVSSKYNNWILHNCPSAYQSKD